jgi:uncharacterized membrane protein (DUF2068 family)
MTKGRDGLVRVIGVFKLVKATLLIALGLGGLLAVPQDMADFGRHALRWTGAFPGHTIIRHAIAKMGALDEATAEKFGVVALAYAAVFVVEGVGLLFRKRWAEWMTVGVTASFVPLELYELFKHVSVGKIFALALNIAIVVYLVWRRVKERYRLTARLARAIGSSM